MSGVLQNNDPPPPQRPASVYPPAFCAGGGHTRQGERGWGVNSSEDARHCSVLYICTGKYFVVATYSYRIDGWMGQGTHGEHNQHMVTVYQTVLNYLQRARHSYGRRLRLHAHPLPPLPPASCLSLSHSSCVSPAEWGRGWGWGRSNHTTSRKPGPL